MNNSKAFNKLTEKYYEAYGKNPEYKYFLEELTDVVRKGKILDIGCGSGLPVARYLVDRGYDVTAVDFSKKMVAEAKKNVPEAEVLYEDFLKMDFDEKQYDGAVCLFTFNYLNKKELSKAIEQIKKAVAEEGGLLIGVIEGDFEGEEKLLGEKVYMRHISESELRGLLSGFHIQLVERRDYTCLGEKPQSQLYITARKHSAVEAMEAEERKDNGEEEEPANDDLFSKQLEEVLSIGAPKKVSKAEMKEATEALEITENDSFEPEPKPAKVRYDDSDEDDEEPAIRITFFKKAKKK